MSLLITDLDFQKTYSYADYLLWEFEQTVELIKGKIFPMAAPMVKHQKASRNLSGLFWAFFKKKPCQWFAAPFDVRLFDRKKSEKADQNIYTVVQPDLCIICDENKLDKKGCIGSPDLVVEILSEGNSKKEMRLKFELYEEVGIKEYWVVDPEHESLMQFVLNEKQKFELLKTYFEDDIFPCHIFPELLVNVSEIFEK